MQEKIIIRNFGPLHDVQIDNIRPYNFFIGASGSGKSTILKLMAFLRWLYKMMCIRSYLKYSGITESPFSFDFKSLLLQMGLLSFLRDDTYIEYQNGSFIIRYDKQLGYSEPLVSENELSLEKISFISDKRNIIGDILENNVTLKKRSFYINQTFEDYLKATDVIKNYQMPGLNVQLLVKKTSTGVKHVIEPLDGDSYEVNLNESSSGTQNTTPLSLIIEYYSKHFDIVSSLNKTVFKYVTESDSLKDFRATTNVGELPNRRVSIFLEEPELSLFPSTQRVLLDSIIADCKSSHNYEMNLMVATHSPYIINHLNILLRRGDVASSLTPEQLGVYHVVNGKLQDLMAQDMDTNEWVVDTAALSEPMEDIYNEYVRLGK